ncbi:TraY domain-containing protein [Patescibacteria group bacterium]|nr:TraY domain-containing protein [Patescibacteria group bacterium]
MLAIKLDKETDKRLQLLAERTHRTKTFYAREAILAYLEDLEDIYSAEETLNNLSSGKSKTITLDEMEKRLNNVEN